MAAKKVNGTCDDQNCPDHRPEYRHGHILGRPYYSKEVGKSLLLKAEAAQWIPPELAKTLRQMIDRSDLYEWRNLADAMQPSDPIPAPVPGDDFIFG